MELDILISNIPRSNFESTLFKEIVKLLGICQDQRDWDRWIPLCLLAYSIIYRSTLGTKLHKIHRIAKEWMEIKSCRMKTWYDRGINKKKFKEGQKVWLFNPQRTKGKTQKLESNWERSYNILRKINDVVFCIGKSSREKNRIVQSD
ncbi:hypothetical protein HZH68_007314 [Vespula germanica]|uniref:Uncharacterized protein n=1 Tax=Vespula germanica TaxID=30212 RepID=A0A834NAZ8_VESGE|nr:hypothetical protein HZH68_007314 [Vespula germanica]